jgi:hypothetical protein
MTPFKLRRAADIFTIIILVICMGILPFFVISTYRINQYITSQIGEINSLFTRLETIHNINDSLIFEALEFRRIEYNGYLSSESEDFIQIISQTMSDYTIYISNDSTLTPEQKKIYLTNVSKIEKAIRARVELSAQLTRYDNNRKKYLDYFEKFVNSYQANWHTVLKPVDEQQK